MKNVFVLPTDKPSRLSKDENYRIWLSINFEYGINDNNKQNIYITSDEEIKEGDWVYCTERKLFGKVIEIQLAKFKSDTSMLYFEINNEEIWCKLFNCKKIILTTDGDLIKEGIQSIDDEFLEWFVKNPSCEEVEVEQEILKLVHNPNYVNHTPEGDGIYLTPKSENLQYGETLIEDNVLDYKIIIPVQG